MAAKNYWNGKRVLITGASAGLGRALALAAADAGALVVAVARGAQRLVKVATHPRVFPIVADISDKNAIYRISGEAIKLLGGVDILINNASALGPTPLRLFLDTSCEDFSDVLETNLLGPFRLTKAILPSMLLHGGGTVINISSDAAVSAYSTWGAYSVSKAALDHLSRIWNEELGERGIRFLALDPGDMNTAMHADAIPESDPAELEDPGDVAEGIIRLLANGDFEPTVRFGASEWRAAL